MKWKASYWWTVLFVVSTLGLVSLIVMIAWPFDDAGWRNLLEEWETLIPSVGVIAVTVISIYFLRRNSQLIQKNTDVLTENTDVLTENTEVLRQGSQPPATPKTMSDYMTLAVISVTVAGMVIALLAVITIALNLLVLAESSEKGSRLTQEKLSGVEKTLSQISINKEQLLQGAQKALHAQAQLAQEVENKLKQTSASMEDQIHEEAQRTRHAQTKLIQKAENTLNEATALMGEQILEEIQQTRHARGQRVQDVEAARERAVEAEEKLQKLESALSLLVIGDVAHMKAALKDCHSQVRRKMLARSSVKPVFNSDDKLWIRASDWIKAAGMPKTHEDYLSLTNPFSFRGSFKDRNGIKRNGHKYYETYRYECPFVPKAGIYGEISIEKQ